MTDEQKATRGGTSAPTPHDLVIQHLAERDWTYDKPDPSVLRVPIDTEAGRWMMLIDVDMEHQMIVCLSVFPYAVVEARRSLVAEYVSNTNYNIAIGSFEMDTEDGDLRFRTSLFYGSSPVTAEIIAHLIDLNVATMAEYYHEIDQLAQE
jgi:hypothetical protein